MKQKPIIVELSFDGNFDLPKFSNVIRIKAKDVLFQKERLLNIALEETKCEKIAWVDCDIIFHNPNWISQASNLLEHYPIIQNFGQAEFRGEDIIRDGFAYRKIHNNFHPPYVQGVGWTGLSWSFRREVGKIYDADIIGGGDVLFAFATMGIEPPNRNALQLKHYQEWAKPFYEKVQGNIHYVPGTVSHMWHGEQRYGARTKALAEIFNPYTDIEIEDKCWAIKNLELKKIMKEFIGL